MTYDELRVNRLGNYSASYSRCASTVHGAKTSQIDLAHKRYQAQNIFLPYLRSLRQALVPDLNCAAFNDQVVARSMQPSTVQAWLRHGPNIETVLHEHGLNCLPLYRILTTLPHTGTSCIKPSCIDFTSFFLHKKLTEKLRLQLFQYETAQIHSMHICMPPVRQ